MTERTLLAGAGAAFGLTGLGLLFGPDAWRSSTSYNELRHLPGGLDTVGAVYLLLGLAQLYASVRDRLGRLPLVLTLGAAVGLGTVAAYVAAAAFGELVAIGGPVLWAFLTFAEALYARRAYAARR